MTLDEAIKHAEEVAERNEENASWFWDKEGNPNYDNCVRRAEEHRQLAEWLRELKKLREQTRWIPVKTRPITPDEIEEFGWEDKDESWMWMYDCELPDDGQEVLIQSEYGIDVTTFYNEGSEGCYFENYEDRDDVIAWMPLPEPYKAESEEICR